MLWRRWKPQAFTQGGFLPNVDFPSCFQSALLQSVLTSFVIFTSVRQPHESSLHPQIASERLALRYTILFFSTLSELCHFNQQPAGESFWSNWKSSHLSGVCFVKVEGTGWGVDTPTHHLTLTLAHTKVQVNKTTSFSASFWRLWDHWSWDLLWHSSCHWHTCVIIVHNNWFWKIHILCGFFIDW